MRNVSLLTYMRGVRTVLAKLRLFATFPASYAIYVCVIKLYVFVTYNNKYVCNA